MAGYSDTPLAKKLGIKEGFEVLVIGAPAEYRALLAPVPASVEFTSRAKSSTKLAHVFATERAALARRLATLRQRLSPQAAVWCPGPRNPQRSGRTLPRIRFAISPCRWGSSTSRFARSPCVVRSQARGP